MEKKRNQDLVLYRIKEEATKEILIPYCLLSRLHYNGNMEFWVFIVLILGCSVGSFLNVLIDRLPVGQDVTRGRSHCDHCKRNLLWYELIPIVSWIVQLGKSRCCHKKLSIQYPVIELITGIGFIYLFFNFQFSIFNFILSLIVYCSVIVLFVTDLKFELLPTPLLVLWGIGVAIRILTLRYSIMVIVYNYALPALGAGLFFFLLWFFSKGKAMGDGDIWLAVLIGLTVGYPGIIIALYIAFLTGAALGVILILVKVKTLKSHIPFGPFLFFAMVVTLLWQKDLLFLLLNYWL